MLHTANLLMHEFEVFLEGVLIHGTLANLKINPGVVVDVVDAHFLAEPIAAQGGIGSGGRGIGARCDETVTLKWGANLKEVRHQSHATTECFNVPGEPFSGFSEA